MSRNPSVNTSSKEVCEYCAKAYIDRLQREIRGIDFFCISWRRTVGQAKQARESGCPYCAVIITAVQTLAPWEVADTIQSDDDVIRIEQIELRSMQYLSK